MKTKRNLTSSLCLFLAFLMVIPSFWGLGSILKSDRVYATEDADLVLHYTFDDDNNIVKDDSGNENDGKIYGKVSSADGIRGKGVYFNTSSGGNSEAYIKMPSDAFKVSEFTYAAFVKYDVNTIGTYARLLAVETPSRDIEYQIMARPGSSLYGYRIELFGGNPQKVAIACEGLFDRSVLDSWHHVALSYDGEEMKFYINGSLIHSEKTKADPSKWNITGAFLGKTASWGDATYSGYMDDVRFYNRALSEGELSEKIKITTEEQGDHVKLLSSLKIDGKTIDAFSTFKDTYYYTVKEGDDYPLVEAEPPFTGASVDITPAEGDTDYTELTVNYPSGDKKNVKVYFVEKLENVKHPDLSDVDINDEFWNDKLKTYLEVTAPYVLKNWVERTHSNLSNFDKVARGDRNTQNYVGGMTWGESDFYASMAGASLFLQKYENKALEEQISSYIDHIFPASESEESGYFSVYNLLMTDGKVFGEGGKANAAMDLFNLGYLIEFGISWYKATGDARMLRVALRFANFAVEYSKGGTVNFVPFHTGVEYNLIALYEFLRENPEVKNEELLSDIEIDENKYLALGEAFISYRGNHTNPPRANGQNYGSYGNDRVHYTSLTAAEGHAVEATLFYYALAEMGRVSDDDSFTNAAYRVWDNIINKQMYITGGVGSVHSSESFGGDYHLPNESYCETCASGSLLQYSDSLSLIFRDSKFQNIVELELYNNLLGGVSEEGNRFFYQNPLNSSSSSRYEWHGVACCTKYGLLVYGNLSRLIYSYRRGDVYVDQYIGSTANITLEGGNVRLLQMSDWAWDGYSVIKIEQGAENLDRLLLRIPDWSYKTEIFVNGEKVSYTLEKGYAVIDRELANGDEVKISADMSIKREYSDEKVTTNDGKVALRRGVFVYCLEEVDNKSDKIYNAPLYAMFDKESEIEASEMADFYGGIKVLKADGEIFYDKESSEKRTLTFIPFYARANRGNSTVAVWVAEETEAIADLPIKLPDGLKELKGEGVKYTADTNGKNPRGEGSKNIQIIVDGNKSSVSSMQYDTFNATFSDSLGRSGKIWFSVEFDRECEVSHVVFYEGGHWNDGGWFGSAPGVQVLVDGKWVDAKSQLTPEYPEDNRAAQMPAGEMYVFVLENAVKCSAVRVIGSKNSLAGHASCSEIEVYGKAGAPDPPKDTTPSVTTTAPVTTVIPTTTVAPTITGAPITTGAPTTTENSSAEAKPIPWQNVVIGVAASLIAASAGVVLLIIKKKK